jgi:hypothetical protein
MILRMPAVSSISADNKVEAVISTPLTLMLAIAAGVIVANIYYVQPLAGLIGGELGVPLA